MTVTDRLHTAAAAVLAAAIALAAPGAADAELVIRITKGLERATPIAVVPFAAPAGARSPPVDVAEVIASDLGRTGRFAPIPFGDLPGRPSRPEDINYSDWRLLGTGNLIIGNVEPLADGRWSVQFHLFDVFRGSRMIGFQIDSSRADLRRTAHRISDLVYQELTGERGAFDTRIAYVTETRGADGKPRYALTIADSDGHSPRNVLESEDPILSPAWSPDEESLAYVSFEGGRPRVFVQRLDTGVRDEIAGFPGLNGAPAFSPDGRYLALTLSKDGNPEIYIVHLASGRLRRLTNDAAIDTEPAWSPGGETIAFTSDRGGSAQVYQMPVVGGRVERLTFEGKYNARPAFSPDGSRLAIVHGDGNGFRIGVLDLGNRALRVLTDTTLDESPSFAPNGSMILYATIDSGGATLAAVSVDGEVRQRIGQEGAVREPAWSPFRDE